MFFTSGRMVKNMEETKCREMFILDAGLFLDINIGGEE
jgi:hypothetical protein